MKGYMYILECCDGSFYTGSTKDLDLRLAQHQAGEGANHTKKRLPVKLVYYEEFDRIDTAFYREKQVQGWSRKKKEALMNKNYERLHIEAECRNESHYGGFGSAQPPKDTAQPPKDTTLLQENGSAQSPMRPRPLSVAEGEGEGEGEAKVIYYTSGKRLIEAIENLSVSPQNLSTPPQDLSTPPQDLSAPPQELNTPPLEFEKSLQLIVQKIEVLNKREHDSEKIKEIIIELCSLKPMKASEIAGYFGKGEGYMKRKYLSEMIKEKQLAFLYQEMLNHPEQAYLTVENN